MSSWKKYGGINQLESFNYITTTNIVTDHLSLRNPYLGVFTICGDLIVDGKSLHEKHAQFNADVSINQSLHVNQNIDVSHDVWIHGKTYQYNQLYFVGISGQGFNRNDSSGIFLLGDMSGIGINKQNPDSTLDIYGTRVESLNVYSTQTTNRNILSRNNINSGIILNTDTSASYIEFYHQDVSINSSNYNKHGGGSIKYIPNGTLVLDTSTNIHLLSTTSISNRTDFLTGHVNNETLTVYDISSDVYLSSIYDNSVCYTGTALSLVASDLSSNTFLKITNTNGSKGWGWGAGAYPDDISRSMMTMGWTDIYMNYIPNQTIVSGNSSIHNRSTIGINTYSPITEKYVLDINGSIRLNHNEVHLVGKTNFEITSVSFSKKIGQTNYGVAVGSYSNLSYEFYSLYTTDGGKKWNLGTKLPIQNTILTTLATTTLTVFMYDISYTLATSSYNILYYSKDYGRSWVILNDPTLIINFSILIGNLTKIISYITTIKSNNNLIRTYLCYNRASVIIIDCQAVNGELSNYNFYNDYTTYIYAVSLTTINSCHGSDSYFFIAGNGVQSFDISSGGFIPKYSGVGVYSSSSMYRCIKTLDGYFTVAAGDNIISYTNDSGVHWSSYVGTAIQDISCNDICIYDFSNVIIVGNDSSNRGKIIFSTDGAKTWNRLTEGMISSMGGNSTDIFNYKITSISPQPDLSNAFIITSSVKKYDTNIVGKSNVYYLYSSSLFNRQTHPALLDICGNMVISGDVNINEDGRLCTTNDTFYILDQNVNNIYFGNDASNIHIGQNILGGTTYIRHRLDVSDNVIFHQQLSINGLVSQIIRDCSNTTNYGYLSFLTQTGADNTAFGYETLNKNNIDGSRNTAVGSSAMAQNIKGNNNSALGYHSLYSNLSGGYNVAVGSSAMELNIIGNNNSALGFKSLYSNVSGDNSALGFQSLCNNISGGNNVAVGSSALFANQSGNNNSALGFKSLYSNVSGDNSALGFQTLYNNISGGNNVAIGSSALFANQSGNNNSALGFQTLCTNITGGNNVAIGSSSLYNNIEGNNNSAIGYNSLYNNNGNYNSSLGYYADICGSYNYSTAVGAYSNITKDHQIILGTSSEYVYIPGNNNNSYGTALVVEGDVSFNQNAYIGNVIYTNSIQQNKINTGLNIGTNANPKTVTIGYTNDTIIINGTIQANQVVNLEVKNSQILLNSGNPLYNSSGYGGIYIYDNGNRKAGYIRVSGGVLNENLGLTSYIFKAPGGSNVLQFDISAMIIDTTVNTNVVMKLKPSPYSDSSYSMVASSLDISNIFVKNIARTQDLTNNTQMINTNLGISGNLFINKDPSGFSNTALDVSGNVIISKLGIGTTDVNQKYYLEVSGDMSQTIGWIHQF